MSLFKSVVKALAKSAGPMEIGDLAASIDKPEK